MSDRENFSRLPSAGFLGSDKSSFVVVSGRTGWMRWIRERADLVRSTEAIRTIMDDYQWLGAVIQDKYEYFRAWLSRGLRLLSLSSSSSAA